MMLWYVYISISQNSWERKKCFLPWWFSNEQHTPHGEQKQQQQNDTVVLQFIVEEISMTMRKGFEVEAKSYQKEEQQSSLLKLAFGFKIQWNQYQMSPKKSKAIPHEVTVREDRKIHNLH